MHLRMLPDTPLAVHRRGSQTRHVGYQGWHFSSFLQIRANQFMEHEHNMNDPWIHPCAALPEVVIRTTLTPHVRESFGDQLDVRPLIRMSCRPPRLV